MTILFTVPGLMGSSALVGSFFGGSLLPGGVLPQRLSAFDPVRSWTHVPTDGGLLGPDVVAAYLQKCLAAAPPCEQYIVSGHSEGAWAIIEWLNNWAPASTIPVDQIIFILGGSSWSTKISWLTGRTYQIIDTTAQWDYYADYPDTPTDPNYSVAQDNCTAGNRTPTPWFHVNGYKQISLDTPDRQNTLDTCNYMFFNAAAIATTLPGVTRDQIETAYQRRYLTPPPIVTPPPTS